VEPTSAALNLSAERGYCPACVILMSVKNLVNSPGIILDRHPRVFWDESRATVSLLYGRHYTFEIFSAEEHQFVEKTKDPGF
jgi:hypothetical protein